MEQSRQNRDEATLLAMHRREQAAAIDDAIDFLSHIPQDWSVAIPADKFDQMHTTLGDGGVHLDQAQELWKNCAILITCALYPEERARYVDFSKDDSLRSVFVKANRGQLSPDDNPFHLDAPNTELALQALALYVTSLSSISKDFDFREAKKLLDTGGANVLVARLYELEEPNALEATIRMYRAAEEIVKHRHPEGRATGNWDQLQTTVESIKQLAQTT